MTFFFQQEIRSMMYASGDIKVPNDMASQYIERVVQAQINRLVISANKITIMRRNKSISVEDICFVIRKNRFKVKRVIDSIIFKELRKKMAEDDANIDLGCDDLQYSWIYHHKRVNLSQNPLFDHQSNDDFTPKLINGEYLVPEANIEYSSEKDELKFDRLKRIDFLTTKMSYDEYLEFSDCRQASFTFRKARKFREFLTFKERLRDNVIDVLGFICYEMVVDIVEEGYKVKEERDEEDFIEKGLFGVEDKNGLDFFEVREACRRLISRKGSIYL